MMAEKLYSLILPFYKQNDHVVAIVQQYEEALRKFPSPYEMILVLNGTSAAESRQLPLETLRRNPSIKILVTEKAGWGLAVKSGLQEARGESLCFLNTARTTPQDLLTCLLLAQANPAVVLKVNRKIRDSRRRRIGSLLYNIECRTLFDLSYWDINGTPKVFPRKFDKLLAIKEDGDLFDLEFNVICRRENYPIVEIPIFSVKRYGGLSTTTWRSALKLYIGAYRLWRQEQHVKDK